MDPKKIERINELARKSKTKGLTAEEKTEQQQLRKEYIGAFRENLRSTLDSVVVVDEHGNRRSLRKDH